VIQYSTNMLALPNNTLTLTPIDSAGAAIDLNDPAKAGVTFAWRCGAVPTAAGTASTVEAKYRPATCR